MNRFTRSSGVPPSASEREVGPGHRRPHGRSRRTLRYPVARTGPAHGGLIDSGSTLDYDNYLLGIAWNIDSRTGAEVQVD